MIRLILTAVALLLAGPALAQFPAPVYQSFAPTARAPDLTAGVATARVALGVVAPVAYVCNTGSVTTYVKLGTVAVVASLTADVPIQASACITLSAAGATHLAGITPSSTAVVQVTLGSGSPSVALGGGSSVAGGATAANQVTEIASLGALADAAYAGSGNASIISSIKGVYAAVVAAGTGSATAANQATEIASLGAIADAAYAGSGNASVISATKGIYAAVVAGTSPVGQAVMASSRPVTVASNQAGFPTFPSPTTSGGLSRSSAVLANSTNATSVKASAGQVYHVQVFNNSASIGYLKFYDKATSPTCNSDTVVWETMIPASTSGAGAVVPIDVGLAFTTGIAYCVTGGIAVNDNTAVAASAFIVNVGYK